MNGYELMELCAAAGLTGDDAESAIRAYRKGGALTSRQVAYLATLPAATRESQLSVTHGSDGSRVAALVVARG